MGKKSDPPPAPDYTGAANATAASNQDAQTRADWANRPTQNTPWGQSSWNATAGVDPSTGKPITNWEQNITLSGPQQQALDQQMQMQNARSGLASDMLGRVGGATSQAPDFSGMQGFGQGGSAGGWGGGPAAGGWNGAGPQGGQWAGQAQSGLGIQGQLDPSLYGDQGRQRVENAMMDRMRPEHEQQTAGLEGKLANMGLSRGSEAWNRESQRLGDQQSRERFNALDRGLQEQQGQFGMAQGAGQFANQAQAQDFGQSMANQNLMGQQLGQNFNQGMQSEQLRGLQNAQNFGQGIQQQNLYGQQYNQNFNQNMQQSDYQNRLRQQQIAEMMMQRNMPLNEMNAMLTGQQVQNPNMPGFNTSQSAGGANLLGAANMQYNAGMDAYNAGQQQSQGMMSGLTSLGSMGMMAL